MIEDLNTDNTLDNAILLDDDAPLDAINQDEVTNIISDSNMILKKITPAKWDALIEILDFITKDSNDESVVIHKSIIMHLLTSGAILKADLLDIFDNQEIDLHISSPKKWVRLFKMFKNETVYIFEENNRFIVTNGQIKLFLPKQLNSVVSKLEFPDFNQTTKISNQVIQKETRDKICNLSKGLQYIEFLIDNNQLKVINIPNTALFILPEYIKDENVKNIDVNNAQLVLRSATFLPYPSDTYQIIIGLNNIKNKYFLYSSCKTQLVSINIYEVLNDATGITDLF